MVQEGTEESFNITQVSYHDQGAYACVPENVPGRGFSAVLNLKVQGNIIIIIIIPLNIKWRIGQQQYFFIPVGFFQLEPLRFYQLLYKARDRSNAIFSIDKQSPCQF